MPEHEKNGKGRIRNGLRLWVEIVDDRGKAYNIGTLPEQGPLISIFLKIGNNGNDDTQTEQLNKTESLICNWNSIFETTYQSNSPIHNYYWKKMDRFNEN